MTFLIFKNISNNSKNKIKSKNSRSISKVEGHLEIFKILVFFQSNSINKGI